MRVNNAEEIVGNVGALVAGVIVSGLTALLMRWIWPDMAQPVFISAVICLVISWGSMVLRDHRKQRAANKSWSASLEDSALSSDNITDEQGKISWDYISDFAISITAGIILGAIVAGLVGLMWPSIRWTVFAVVLLIWGMTGISVMIQDWKVARSREKR